MNRARIDPFGPRRRARTRAVRGVSVALVGAFFAAGVWLFTEHFSAPAAPAPSANGEGVPEAAAGLVRDPADPAAERYGRHETPGPPLQTPAGAPSAAARVDSSPGGGRTPADAPTSSADEIQAAALQAEKRGDWEAALAAFRSALALEPGNPVHLESAARAARRLRRLDEAQALLERALRAREQEVGPDDPSVGSTLRQLAGVYQDQERYAEAEQAYLRALGINEEAYGHTHIAVSATLTDLAYLYQREGRHAESLPLLESALEVEERALGPAHPNVAARRTALAQLYRDDGRYDEAVEQLEEALFIKEQAFAPDDPETTGILTSLALLYGTQERYAEAESLLERALVVNEAAYGSSHPRVAMDLANLGVVHLAQAHYAEAAPYYEEALVMEDALAWSETPQVSVALDHLARSAAAQGRKDAAEKIYLWAIEVSERALGPGSANTAFLLERYDEYLRTADRVASPGSAS